ncbi:MAG: CAAX prenyl protease-related protein [Limisphaerales bacterium]
MSLLKKISAGSPAVQRVAPFVIFVLLTAGQGQFGPASAYWFYLAKTLVGAWLIFEMRPLITEMRWALSWEAVVVGIGIFFVWIGISGGWTAQDSLWVKLGFAQPAAKTDSPWDPLVQFGGYTVVAWFFIIVHIVGMTLVVPPLEEVFYRSFLYRYFASHNFLTVPLNRFLPWPFLVTILVFGCAHNEWLAGILCGAAYQWLVIRKNRLGDAMTAHAITNFLLGIYVVWRGAWHFW